MANRAFLFGRALFSDETVHRQPCAGGVRVLAAERAILRIAYVVRNFSDGVPEGTVLVAEQ